MSPKVDQFDTSKSQLIHFAMNTDLPKICNATYLGVDWLTKQIEIIISLSTEMMKSKHDTSKWTNLT